MRTTSIVLTLLGATWLSACASENQPPPPAAVPPAAAATASPAPVVTEPTNASEVLARGRAPFDACYALARASRPDLGRTSVEITFSMDDQGKLITVELQYRNRMDDAAKDCMRKAAEALKFPPSLHGTEVGTIQFTPPA